MELADQELLAEFVVESQEGLANIEQQMLAIEANGANIDTNLVNGIFRTMHSIKGAAGFLGLNRVEILAHGLEEILNHLRNHEVIPTSELVTSVLSAADCMKSLFDAIEASNEADVSAHVNALQRFRPRKTNVEPEMAANLDIAPEQPISLATEPLSPAVLEFLVECYENLDQMERDLVTLEEQPQAEGLLRGIFRTMHTIKGGAGFLGLSALETLAHVAENLLAQLRGKERPLAPPMISSLLATVDACRAGLHRVEQQGNDVGFDPHPLVAQLQQLVEAKETTMPLAQSTTAAVTTPVAIVPEAKVPSASTTLSTENTQNTENTSSTITSHANNHVGNETMGADKNSSSTSDSTIRVDVSLLDKLMTRVGELVLARNQILQHANGLDDANLLNSAQRLNLITTELQESVMKTRMQPIGNVWSKFPRVVRDLSSLLGKQVRIEMEGKETELDKTIVEAIKDPLTHVVRNSIDHGIETPQTRLATGKSAEGVLYLRAYHEGGQVNIEISDDGAGLNIERIRNKALERGLVGKEQANRMSDRDIMQLVLLPGFSTAEKVTSVSGRGVGMDVVKTNIERIGGTIDLHSEAGLGTTVKIKIPLTLAIIPALIATSGGARYAIPQVSLQELVRLEGTEAEQGIEYVHGAPVYRLRGKLLPLVNLTEQLQRSHVGASSSIAPALASNRTEADDSVVNIVVLRANEQQFGLIVDRVIDTEEIVVKPLSRQLKSLSAYAGATIMGDGTVALILDVMGLASTSGVVAQMREGNGTNHASHDTQQGQATQTLLIVDLGDTRRFALPTSMVSRLEKIAANAIEVSDGREVIQYRSEILPLVHLSRIFGTSNEFEQNSELQIIVYAEQGLACGFVVNRIVDIVETELRFQTKKHANDMLLGTIVIQQHVTDVLNLRNIATQATGGELVS